MTPSTVYAAREGQKFKADRDLTVVTCATCHITYAIPTSLYTSALAYPGDTAGGWKLCCPMGHTWWYTGESVEDKLKRERARSGRLSARLDQTQADLRYEESRRRAQKAATTRAKKRHAAGVCPCCNRTFQQLTRHMASQHPNYDPAKP